MNFKILFTRISLLMFFLGIHISANAQYAGGDGDGYDVDHLNTFVNGTQLQLYSGGNGDGYSQASLEVILIAECVIQNLIIIDDDPIAQEIYTARNIESAGSVKNSSTVEFRASRNITLKPNFIVEKNSTFLTTKGGCLSQPVNF